VNGNSQHVSPSNASAAQRPMVTRRLPTSPLLALLVCAAAICTGCGSSGPSPSGEANGSGGKPTAREQAVKFADCIRTHGVPHFPDPNAKNDFEFGIDVAPAVWRKAVDACKDLQPPGTLDAHRTPAQQSATLRFAACVREHGVKDFPDPANGDPLVDTTHIPSSNRPGGMTVLNAAMQTCHSLASEAVGDR
jgi:hypothetical protein